MKTRTKPKILEEVYCELSSQPFKVQWWKLKIIYISISGNLLEAIGSYFNLLMSLGLKLVVKTMCERPKSSLKNLKYQVASNWLSPYFFIGTKNGSELMYNVSNPPWQFSESNTRAETSKECLDDTSILRSRK